MLMDSLIGKKNSFLGGGGVKYLFWSFSPPEIEEMIQFDYI